MTTSRQSNNRNMFRGVAGGGAAGAVARERRGQRRRMAARTAAVVGVMAMLATTLMLAAGGPEAFAGGPPYDGPQTGATGPAFFGPAPNPVPYCENPTYFDPFPENVNQVGRLDVNAAANEASVTTDGITMNFNITAEGDPGGQYPGFFGDAPGNVDPSDGFGPNDQPKGVEMASDDAAVVTLVDQDGNPAPLFYSQWVFTDVDRANEGFFVTPTYTDPGAANQIAIFAGEEDFTFANTTAATAAFNDTDTVAQDSEDIEARVQVDVLGAVTGITMLRDTGSGQSGFAVGGGCEAAGAAKTIIAGPTWNGTSFDVTYELRLRNNLPSAASIGADVLAAQLAAAASTSTGTPSGIDLENVQLIDDLADTAFSDIAVVDIANPGIAPQGQLPLNLDYNGLDDTELLLAGAQVDPSTNELIVLQVQYTPDLDTGNWDDCAVGYVYSNQSIVSGSAANVLVQDQSDDGINPDPGVGNGNDGVDDATLVTFPCPPASLQIVKTVVPGPTGTCPTPENGVVGEGQPLNAVEGSTVTYCISVSNPGTSPATGVVVSDPQNPGGDEAIGTLAGGAASSFSYDLVVDDQTPTTNIATATGTGPDGALGPVSDPALISVSPQPDPILTIVKTVVADGEACPSYENGVVGTGPALPVTDGGSVTYCLSVRNIGTGPAFNVEVNDSQAPASFNGVIGDLAAGETVDLSYSVAVTLATPEVNTAIVSGDGPNGTVPSVSDDALIDISPQLDPALEIVKTVIAGPAGTCPAFADGIVGLGDSLGVLFGETVTYCISVRNASGSTATDVVISDPLAPAGFDGVIGTLAVADAPVTRSFDLVIDDATPLINTASVNGSGPNGALPTESDQAQIASAPQPDPVLEIVKTVINGPNGACPAFADGVLGAGAMLDVIYGETVTYCISVRNAGLAPATDVAISDPQAPASFDGAIGDLPIDAEATRSFDLIVDAATPPLNTATVNGQGPNGAVPPDTDQAVVNPQPPADPVLQIVKTVLEGPAANCPAFADGQMGAGQALIVDDGDTVTYCISVTNAAGTDATDVVISDPQAPASFDGVVGALAVGESADRSFDLVVDDQTPAVNTATVNGNGPNGAVTPDSDQAVIDVVPLLPPVLDIVKTVIPGPAGNCPAFDDGVVGLGAALPALYGDTVTYCISVRNIAGSPATNVVISDAQAPASFDGVIGDLAVGETAAPRSFDLVVDAQTPDINTAQATGNGPNGPLNPVNDQARIRPEPQPDPVLDIVKTVIPGPAGNCPAYADGTVGLGAALGVVAGDTVTYCISVTNSSGSDATNVVISDPMAPASFDGNVGDLAVGAFATRSFDLVIAIDTTPVNTATVGGDGPNGAVAPTTDQAVIAPRLPLDPVLEIVKTVLPGPAANCPLYADGVAGIGAPLPALYDDIVTYCISITNSSGTDATDVVISDPMAPASFDGAIGDLAVGAFATRSFDVTVDDQTEQVNTATVNGNGPNGAVAPRTDQARILPSPQPDPILQIVKTVVAGPAGQCPSFDDGVQQVGPLLPVTFGDTVTYCLTVTNIGQRAATSVVISDQQAPASFDGAIGTLEPDAEETRSFDLVIDQLTPTVNTARVDGEGPNGVVAPDTDQAGIDPSDAPLPRLDIIKTVVAGPAGNCPDYDNGIVGIGPALAILFGDTVTYCISVANLSDVDANNVVITDAQAPASFDGVVGDLAGRSEITRSYDVVVATTTPTVNTALVSGRGPDGRPAPGDSDTALIAPTEVAVPLLDIVKTVLPGPAANCPAFADGVVGPGAALAIEVGDTATYCLTVRNLGLGPATNVAISDPQAPAAFDGVVGDLASETEVTRSFDLVIAADTPTVNTATVSGDGPNGALPPVTDTALIDVTLLPNVAIVKTVLAGPAATCPAFADGVAGQGTALDVEVGDTATYCLTVRNSGLGDASSVVISDPQAPAGFDGVIGGLSAGVEVTRSFDLVIAADTPAVNTATVNGEGPNGPLTPVIDTALIGVILQPDLAIVKTVLPGPGATCPAFADGIAGQGAALDVIVGDTATYCLTVRNNGLGDASNVTISDPQAPGSLDGDIGILVAGTEATRSFDLTIAPDSPTVNTATVNGDGPNGPLAPVNDTALIAVVQFPDLAIVKTVLPGPGATCPSFADGVAGPGTALDVIVGDTATYCLTVRNDGLGDATNVAIADPQAPAGFDGAVGDLAAGTEQTRSFDIVVTLATPTVNTATVTGDGPNGPVSPVTDTALIAVEGLPALVIVKTVLPGPAANCPAFADGVAGQGAALDVIVGDTATYCLTVRNGGLGPATGVVISDPQAPAGFDGAVGDLAAGNEETRSFDIVVASDTPTVNTATVTGVGPNGALPPVTDTALIAVVELPDLAIVKTVLPGPDATCPAFADGVAGQGAALDVIVGDTATYCLTVRNIGLGDATNVVISDPQAPAGFDGAVGDLAAGTEATRRFDIEVASDTPTVNTASVTGEGPNGVLPPTTDTALITVVELPLLEIVKTAVPGPAGTCPSFDDGTAGRGDAVEITVDEVVTYCVSVRNVGAGPATDVEISDPQAPGDIVVGDLAPDQTFDDSYDVTVTETTPLINVATVSGNGPAGPLGDSDEAEISPADRLIPSIRLDNTVVESDGDCADAQETIDEYLVGLPAEPVRWCFVVTNTGNTPLTNIVFDDENVGLAGIDVLAVHGGGATSLAPGDSIAFSSDDVFPTIGTISRASVLATPSEADGTPIPELANVTADNDAVVESTAVDLEKLVQTDPTGNCDTATADGQVNLGDTVIWCFTVTNTGGVDVRVTEVNDSVLGVTIPIPEAEQVLETGESVSVAFETTINSTIANQADVVGVPTDDDGNPIPGAPTPRDDDTTIVRALAADLSIVKTNSNAGPIERGGSLSYTLVVANDGPDPAQDVVLVDKLPTGLSYDVLPAVDGWTCELAADDDQEMTCTKETELAVDAEATLIYTAKVDANTPWRTTLTNVVEVTSSTPDPDLTNNSDDSSTRTPPPPVVVYIPPPALDPPPPPDEPDEILELVITGSSSHAMVLVSTMLLGMGGFFIVASRRRRDDALEAEQD